MPTQHVAGCPAADATLATVERIASAPTAPYHEHRAMRAIASELAAIGVATELDAYGQLHARAQRGSAAHALALFAHTDHPAFDVVKADGREGRARVLGGFYARNLATEVRVRVCDDGESAPFDAVLDDFVPAIDVPNNSLGHCRIRAKAPLAVGQWAVLDLPGFEAQGDELHLRAADDLALCAVVVLTLAALRDDPRPHDIHAVFTRAEETGLYGARLVAEDGLVARDAIVVSLEAGRALPQAAPGRGVVVRPGDLYNTFSNDGERFCGGGRSSPARYHFCSQQLRLLTSPSTAGVEQRCSAERSRQDQTQHTGGVMVRLHKLFGVLQVD